MTFLTGSGTADHESCNCGGEGQTQTNASWQHSESGDLYFMLPRYPRQKGDICWLAKQPLGYLTFALCLCLGQYHRMEMKTG